ncbi:MAG: ATP-binding cassette domain-containing protein, partial [archaeon]
REHTVVKNQTVNIKKKEKTTSPLPKVGKFPQWRCSTATFLNRLKAAVYMVAVKSKRTAKSPSMTSGAPSVSPTSSPPSVVVENVRKSFGKVHALNGITFSIQKGEVLALLGPNGSGKTTTVRVLSTLIKPDSGKATVDGKDVVSQSKEVKNTIGLTGQFAAVDEYLTGEENLRMIGRLYRLSHADVQRRTNELLSRFDLVEAAKRPVKTYSGGMRRRLDIAMSLIASPKVLFLDEPTTGLDPRARLVLWDIVKQLAATDVTVLLTTQYMEEADQLADRIVIIDKGKVIAEGTADALKAKVGSDRIEVTISKTSNMEEAKKAMGDPVQVDSKRRTLSIASKSGAKELKGILDRLDRAKIEVENVSLHRPTLDDVFLALTGHTTTVEKEEKEW